MYEAGIMFYSLSPIFPTSVMRGADERRGAVLQSMLARRSLGSRKSSLLQNGCFWPALSRTSV